MKILVFISLIFSSGCGGEIIATTDGTNIRYNQKIINKYHFPTIKSHEDNHMAGLKHCSNRKCLMYYSIKKYEVKELCKKCEERLERLRTILNWIEKVYKE